MAGSRLWRLLIARLVKFYGLTLDVVAAAGKMAALYSRGGLCLSLSLVDMAICNFAALKK